MCEKEGSAVALTAVTGAMVEEEEGTQDAGKTVARARSGATGLVRTVGKISLVRAPGGIALRATPVFLHCLRHQDEGDGGFQESRAIACILGGLRPQPLNASSSSSPAK